MKITRTQFDSFTDYLTAASRKTDIPTSHSVDLVLRITDRILRPEVALDVVLGPRTATFAKR